MSLSSAQLEAFAAVAKSGNFSQAAKSLYITQSALSQRVLNLESALNTALIIRDPAGLRLTPAGEELLRYWQVKDSLEQELLTRLASAQVKAGGTLRIAGFSSVMRSVVMPALGELVAENPNINIELFSRELRELPLMLSRNEADLIVTTSPPFKEEIESYSVGFEENVLVTSAHMKARSEIFLDHDPSDDCTAQFFALQGNQPKSLHRNYLDEVYAIMEGVRLGWGRAVLPKHLVKGDPDLKVVKGHKPLRLPIMVQYFRQSYYSKLHLETVECLRRAMPKLLGAV